MNTQWRIVLAALTIGAACAARPASADRMVPYSAQVEEQTNVVPPAETPLATVFEQLESGDVALKEGAFLWLLRANKAEDLGSLPFPKLSIRFHLDQVTKKEAGGIAWRVVECSYLSRESWHSGTTYRATARVIYLFDDLGRLRDWFEGYEPIAADDFNGDGRFDVAMTPDSSAFNRASPFVIYSYDRVRTREMLRLEGDLGPAEGWPEDDPFEVITPPGGGPAAFKIRGHGTYVWNASKLKYLPEEPKEKP